ncbi:CBS domain-containing protein [Halovivax gelatinilyticus]|uniref:CBS domain-containing protein n=1 Tax=Halovivax gelatinilyticus TaxID=2961597 RepID=UPI0020CA47C0|nr:CBS domain-containing protein [Halovivax gelatinilyticus]
MTLTEIATTDVVTVDPDTEIRAVLTQMDERHVGSAVVTDGDDPTGIITDRMIAMAFRETDSVTDLVASDVMTDDLVTTSEDRTHYEVLETMRDEGIRRLPIVSDGTLSGIITLDDLLMVTAAELSNASDVIERQASGS